MMHLTAREKLLAVASAIFILAWILFTFAIRPAMARVETLSRVIPQKQADLQRLRAKSKEYILMRDSLYNLRTKVSSQDEKFELLSSLESLIRQRGLEAKVLSIRQQELPVDEDYYVSIVQIRLENLTLEQLIDLLQNVESFQVLAKIKSLQIKKNPTSANLLDSMIEIHNPKLVQRA